MEKSIFKKILFIKSLVYCQKNEKRDKIPTIQLFISTWEKSYEDICHFPLHVSVITGNILITIAIFDSYHHLVASNSTFMTNSMYLGTI